MGAILVTGGAGYIGSHTIRQLTALGRSVVVLDNLSTGFRWAVARDTPFVLGDIGDREVLRRVIGENGISSIIHFAAHLVVEESVRNPSKYYENNVVRSKALIETALNEGIEHFIFSSTCAVYGNPPMPAVHEEVPTAPVSPYGKTKLVTEWMLNDLSLAAGNRLRWMALRYFNVAGARLDATLGQATHGATQLVKVLSEVVCGKRPNAVVYGTDYPTPDGTAIRDYIHVEDLAALHIEALNYLERGGASEVLNCGYGKGYSVFDVISAMKRVSQSDFPVQLGPRRAGDAVALYSDTRKLKSLFPNWNPTYADLELICRSGLEWERARTSVL